MLIGVENICQNRGLVKIIQLLIANLLSIHPAKGTSILLVHRCNVVGDHPVFMKLLVPIDAVQWV